MLVGGPVPKVAEVQIGKRGEEMGQDQEQEGERIIKKSRGASSSECC